MAAIALVQGVLGQGDRRVPAVTDGMTNLIVAAEAVATERGHTQLCTEHVVSSWPALGYPAVSHTASALINAG